MAATDRSLDLPSKPNLRPSEVALFLNISISTIYEMIREEILPARKIGRQYRVPRAEFVA